MGIGMWNGGSSSFGINSQLTFGQAVLLQHSAYKIAKNDADKRFAAQEDSENRRIEAILGASDQLNSELAETGEIIQSSVQDLSDVVQSSVQDLSDVVQNNFHDLSATIHQSSKALGAFFNYGIGLLVDELRNIETVQLVIQEELAAIHTTLRTPLKVQVAELMGKGFFLLSRDLPDKALVVFRKVLDLDETNIMAQFQVGRIYLYGIVEETVSLIDLEKARLHLKDARRYAAAELKHSQDYLGFYLEICFTLGVANYGQAIDFKLQGNKDGAEECGRSALALFMEVEQADVSFTEATYQKIRCMKLLGQSEYIPILQSLIVLDKNYFLKAYYDNDLVEVREQLLIFLWKHARCSVENNHSEVDKAPSIRIGDDYEGGIVFYLDGKGGGLVAAPSDTHAGIRWDNGKSCNILSASGKFIGNGKANTAAIIAALGKGSYAAMLCHNLSLGGFSDWFLPSRDELDLMYINLKEQGLGGFGSGKYWSSSQHKNYAGDALNQEFSDGNQGSSSKSSFKYAVRAVRAFNNLPI